MLTHLFCEITKQTKPYLCFVLLTRTTCHGHWYVSFRSCCYRIFRCYFRTFFINGYILTEFLAQFLFACYSPRSFLFDFDNIKKNCIQMCYKFVEKRSMCHRISPAANFNDCIFDRHRSMGMQHSSNTAPYIHSQNVHCHSFELTFDDVDLCFFIACIACTSPIALLHFICKRIFFCFIVIPLCMGNWFDVSRMRIKKNKRNTHF